MAFQAKLETILIEGSMDPETVATKTVTGLTQSYDRQEQVTSGVDSGLLLMWNGDDNVLSSFTIAILQSDVDVEVEITTGEGQADEELNSYTLAADVAMVFGSGVSRRNHSASDAYAGTLDTMDLIRLLESNGLTANVRLRLYS